MSPTNGISTTRSIATAPETREIDTGATSTQAVAALLANESTSVIQPRTHVYVPDLDLASLSLDELSNSEIVYNRELNWLDFNWRVLNEAMD